MAEAPDTPLDFREGMVQPQLAGAPPTIFLFNVARKATSESTMESSCTSTKTWVYTSLPSGSRSPAPRRIPIGSGWLARLRIRSGRVAPRGPCGTDLPESSLYMPLDGLKPRRANRGGGEELIPRRLPPRNEIQSESSFGHAHAWHARRVETERLARDAAARRFPPERPPDVRSWVRGRREASDGVLRRPRAAACARLGCRTCASLRPAWTSASRTLLRPVVPCSARRWRRFARANGADCGQAHAW